MRGIFFRWLVLTAAILIASYLLDGIQVTGFVSAFFAAAVLGILNALFRPILVVLTLPITVLSLGLFLLVINAVMLLMASGVISGFVVTGFWPAVFGSLIISIVSGVINGLIGGKGNVDVIDLRHRGGNRWE